MRQFAMETSESLAKSISPYISKAYRESVYDKR